MNILQGLAIGGLSLSMLSAGSAIAQTSDEEAANEELREDVIVVYGNKNASALDDVSASVGLVTSEDIQNRQLRNIRDSFRTLGNVFDTELADSGFIIRGINSEGLTPGGDPLAALYIDGAQQSSNGARRGASGLWDVQQVEVYRGPQSTLSGRAALAGAIYIKTIDPTNEWDARARLTAGNQDTRGAAFAFGGPIVEDQVAFRISGDYEVSESVIDFSAFEAFDRFDDFNEDEYYQVRGKLLITPDGLPNTRILGTVSVAHDSPLSSQISGPGSGFEFDDRIGFGTPGFTESRSADNTTASLEITHDLSDDLVLTSLTTYALNDTERPSVNQGSDGVTQFIEGFFEQTLFTQEFRLNYTSDQWRNVLGLYYASEDGEAANNIVLNPVFALTSSSESEFTNLALFGEAAYAFAPTWEIVVGGRFDLSDQEGVLVSGNSFTPTPNVTETSSDEVVFLPKLSISKELTPTDRLAFTVQRGFRTGGSGIQPLSGEEFFFDPEFTWTYELSYRGSFADDQLSVNANIFYTDWIDQQVEFFETPGNALAQVTTNSASSRIVGFELDARLNVTPAFDLFAGIGYADTEFEEFIDPRLGDLSGNPFPRAPKWNASFGGDYQNASGFFAGADLSYSDEYVSNLQVDPDFVDPYAIVNAQVGFRTDRWEFALFAENLFDHEYLLSGDFDSTTDTVGTLGQTRLIGANLTVDF